MQDQPVLFQFDFPFSGPFGAGLENALQDLAGSMTREPGFRWIIWTKDASARQAGGIYLFRDHASAAAYVAKHTARRDPFGITEPRARSFDINLGLTRQIHGPVSPPP